MDESIIYSIKGSNKSHRVKRPTQTGFSSPATHYTEPRIDLNDALVPNTSATFFVRVEDCTFQEFHIFERDVLIVDRSLRPKENQLVLAIIEDGFTVVRIDRERSTELNVWGVITYIIKSVL